MVGDVQSINEQGWLGDVGDGVEDVRKMLGDEGESGGSMRTSLPFCYFLRTVMRLPFTKAHVTSSNRQEESSISRLISNRQRQALTHVSTSFSRPKWAAGTGKVAI
jgi:hypothetical protein